MKDESEPITSDEWLLRRVQRVRFRTDRVPRISPNSFAPRTSGRDIDTEGISLYRAACLGDPSEILATSPPEEWANQGIVRIPVSLLVSLGLSVRSSPDAQVKGHVVVPELNADRMLAEKRVVLALLEPLATEASLEENILREPAPPES